jgi:hypothetical protein
MKICGCILGAVILAANPTAAQQPGHQAAHQPRSTSAGGIDQDYVLALSAADQFLFAWATRNEDEGMSVLSARLKNKYPEEYFRSFLSGISNPHHQAFEVGRGKRLPSGGFAFPVTMYEHYSGQKESNQHPKPLRIVVIQAGPESWSVDEMPGFVAPEPSAP